MVSTAGDQTRAYETDLSAAALRELADVSYKISNVGAAIASGSFRADGMLIAPCSVRTLAEVACRGQVRPIPDLRRDEHNEARLPPGPQRLPLHTASSLNPRAGRRCSKFRQGGYQNEA